MTEQTLDLIGRTLGEAASILSEQDYSYRVVCRDGRYYACTRDVDNRRVNLTITDGKITDFGFG